MAEPTAPAPSQPSADPKANDQPADPAKPAEPAKGKEGEAKEGGDQFDPKVLESEELWKQPRIKELLAAKKERDDLVAKQKEAEEKSLESQKKFKELADKKSEEVKTLTAKLEATAIDQALTTKLAGEGVVDLDGALKLTDRAKLSVDDNGTVQGVDDAINALKQDRAYLFTNESGQPAKPKVGTATNPGQKGEGEGTVKKFKRSQLADRKFYEDNREDILKAQKAGMIEDDLAK